MLEINVENLIDLIGDMYRRVGVDEAMDAALFWMDDEKSDLFDAVIEKYKE